MRLDRHDLAGRPLIVGGGIAGLMTALCLAPEPIVLLSKASLGDESSSVLAQGGMAASLGAEDDPALHMEDTLAAGDGLCDPAAVRRIIEPAPAAVGRLDRLGVAFDRTSTGTLQLGLEAAHSRRRIVHAAGDATGRELVRALVAAVRHTPSIELVEDVEVRRLFVADGKVSGALAIGPAGAMMLETGRIVLATGATHSYFGHEDWADVAPGAGRLTAFVTPKTLP